ncbi:SPOR domain-containing protein [Gilvibacter sp.]|uniref:HU domain-containing protein n=1 Tax=Gilvibacter sp. TaxID=2729997 RepID=UPI003B518578
MRLDSYISDLLYRYECVILPGFGAFLTQYQPARIHESTDAFYPPSKLLSFNRQLQSNDGLLADHIAKSKDISYADALTAIRSYTRFLEHELEAGKNIIIEAVGSLAMEAGKISFEPSAENNYLTASFGLSQFVQPAMSRSSEEAIALKAEPLLFTPTQEQRPVYLKYAAIGLIAIGLTSFGGLKIYESGVKQHNYVQSQDAKDRVQNSIQEATFVISNPLPSLEVNLPKYQGRYHIIAGAFREEANAHKKIAQLQAQGFEARLLGKNKYGLHQVSYESHSERSAALKALRNIKNNNNKDAWLLVKQFN